MIPPVTTQPDYDALIAAWQKLADSGVLSLQTAPANGAELLHATIERADAPLVVISAGVHGDEPIGPSALLQLVSEGLPERFSYVLWPCTNPAGYRAGTRANAHGVDINRSFGDGRTPESLAIERHWPRRVPVLTLDLHQDYEASGFYCYERTQETNGCAQAPRIVAAVEAAGIPIQTDFGRIDLGHPVAEAESSGLWRVERGWIQALRYAPERPESGRPFSVWSGEQGVPHSFTFEAPGLAAWERRLLSLNLAVRTALALCHSA
ncbi:MAG: DUF2817 domain-containing protein [bacterium]|nr:DUF2817 domain-containing protein [bacterium]